jgi:hypothetical protein
MVRRQAWLLGSLFLVTDLRAAPPAPAVMLGGEAVPDKVVQMALESCAGLAEPEGECLRARWLPAFRYALSASAEKLEKSPGFARKRADLLLQELFLKVTAEAPPPTPEELRDYYGSHRHEFVKPERFRIFRILLGTEQEASDFIAALPAVLGLEAWRALSRTRSVDHATHERGGDLGFVGPDGNTDVPEVRVDPKLYEAARQLKDGEILRRPVLEGQRFAVVWRRGSLSPSEKSLADVAPALGARLSQARGEERVDELISRLRATELHDFSPQKLAIYFEARKSLERPAGAP